MPDDDQKLVFEDIPAMISHITNLGTYSIRTKDEESQYWKNTVGKEVDNKVKSLYTNFEQNIGEATGIEKVDGEKATEFLKRSITEILDNHKGTVTDMQKKLDTKLKESEAAAEVQKQYDTFREKVKVQATEYEQTISDLNMNAFSIRVSQQLEDARERIRPLLKKDIDTFLIDNTMKAMSTEMANEVIPKDVNGVIVFNDKDDKPIMDAKDGHMLTAYEILFAKFPEDLIEKQRVQGGAGSGSNGQPAGDGSGTGENKFDLVLPEDVVNVGQLIEHIKKTFPALGKTDREFNDYYRANKDKVKFEL